MYTNWPNRHSVNPSEMNRTSSVDHHNQADLDNNIVAHGVNSMLFVGNLRTALPILCHCTDHNNETSCGKPIRKITTFHIWACALSIHPNCPTWVAFINLAVYVTSFFITSTTFTNLNSIAFCANYWWTQRGVGEFCTHPSEKRHQTNDRWATHCSDPVN